MLDTHALRTMEKPFLGLVWSIFVCLWAKRDLENYSYSYLGVVIVNLKQTFLQTRSRKCFDSNFTTRQQKNRPYYYKKEEVDCT